MKKFTVNPQTITSSTYTGLSSADDGLLFEWMYEYYRANDDLPEYQTVIDEWDDRVSRKVYDDAYRRLYDAISNLEFYFDGHEWYLELLDDATLSKIDVPDWIQEHVSPEGIDALYHSKIDWAADRFEAKSGVNLELLGRSGRHVCVDETVNNVLRYEELVNLARDLEQQVVEYMNNLSDKDIVEVVESATDVSSGDTAYIITYGYDDGGPEDGPIWHSYEDLVYAPSEDEALKLWYESCEEPCEGAFARLATSEEIERYEQEEADWQEFHAKYPDAPYIAFLMDDRR